MAEPHVQVSELLSQELAELHLRVLCGESYLDRRITHPRLQKPGLAFAGYYEYVKAGRVQIIGASEVGFIATLEAGLRGERFRRMVSLEIPVFVFSKGLEPPAELLELCRGRGIPVLSSTKLTSIVIKEVSYFLEERLLPSTGLHAVLLDIYGLGVLLTGRSGVGKSECALDLITRGHSLVADDKVTVRRYPSGDLIGYSAGAGKHHMELRGLGIINVKDLYGLASVRERKSIDLVVELEPWVEGKVYDRLGLEESVYTVLDTPVPYIRMPVATGRNLSILVEVAARNHVLKMQGHDSSREFVRRLEAEMERGRHG